jgi:hypothetical protein
MQTTLDDPKLKKPLHQLEATYVAYKHQELKERDLSRNRFEYLLEAIYAAARCAGPQEFYNWVESKRLEEYKKEITPETFENELERQKQKMPVLTAIYIEKEDQSVPKVNLEGLGIFKRKEKKQT